MKAPKPTAPNLAEVAARIAAHLKRFETDPLINVWKNGRVGGTRPYFWATARAAGSRVAVQYISYQGWSTLTKVEALAYLAWLDAGNVGRHHRQQEQAKAADAGAKS